MVKNKNGLMRIVEAMIAILIILGVILVVSSRKDMVRPEQDYNEIMRKILDEIAKNGELRSKILHDTRGDDDAENTVEDKVKDKVNYLTVGYDVIICDLNQIDCGINEYPRDAAGQIYSQERIISANLDISDVKVVKLYLWRRKV